MDPAYNGEEWISHFQCTTTGFNLVYTHRHKGEATDIIERALQFIKTQFKKDVRFMRLDGERSLGKIFDNILARTGIKSGVTAPDTPAQNGGAERAGRTILKRARSMRMGANLPANLWPETFKAAGYLCNRTPVKKLGWKTPFEAVKHLKPHTGHFHVFGCKSLCTKAKERKTKKGKTQRVATSETCKLH